MRQLSERKFDLNSYRTISLAISTYEDMQILLQHLAEGICRTFNIKGSSIFLYDETENQLFRVSSFGLSKDYINKGALFIDQEYQEFLEGKSVLIDDLKNDAKIKYTESAAKEGLVSIFSIPIKYKNAIVGLLKNYLTDDIMPHDDDLESINTLMHQLGLVIELNGLQNFVSSVKIAVDNLPTRFSDK